MVIFTDFKNLFLFWLFFPKIKGGNLQQNIFFENIFRQMVKIRHKNSHWVGAYSQHDEIETKQKH